MHKYYSYTIEELMGKTKIPLRSLNSTEDVFRMFAREMADKIIMNNANDMQTKFILPVGPIGQYPFFVEIVNTEKISLKNCWFFNMDEYLKDDRKWISSNHILSFRGFMEREVYSRIDDTLVNPPSHRIFPDPDNPKYLTRLLEQLGGADICFGGIGINGHLAFNEAQYSLAPEQLKKLTTRVIEISKETRTTNAIGDLGGAIEDMPNYAITIGMQEILASKVIRLAVMRNWHRAVIRRAACGEIDSSFPVSLLQEHQDTIIYMNDIVSERAF